MSEAGHSDPSKKWLLFFFVCFGMTVFAIGVFAMFTYKVDAPDAPASGGHGMLLPEQQPQAHHWIA
jgi:hypothetical protein